VELEATGAAAAISRRMSSQRNKVHHVHTVAYVARKLGVDEELIHDLTLGLEPEDGVIWVYGLDDDGVLAFTDDGIEEVRLILEEYRSRKPPKA
jgi:hypothetical protein